MSEFYEVLSAAIADLSEHGYVSPERLEAWLQRLGAAARRGLIPEAVLVQTLRQHLTQVFERTQTKLSALPVSQFTLAQVRPKLRAELDRRIVASASLIKLNREKAITETLQRFSGWATSIPIGGAKIDPDERKKVRRGIAGLSFVERRVVIDQGHKLAAAVNEIVAVDGGAIAGIWRHTRRGPPEYDSRPEHVARDGTFFVVRDNWALQKGLMKLAGRQYTDQIEAPGQLVYCSCTYRYVFALRDLPPEMLTAKGKQALLDARAKVQGFLHGQVHA